MKVVIDVPNELVEQVRDVVHQGDYDEPREFIALAIENQIELENSSDDDGGVVSFEQAVSSNDDQTRTDGNAVLGTKNALGNIGPGALSRTEYDRVSTTSMPDVDRLEDGPLWGQYNRIFPVKLTLRLLANELRNQAVHATSQVDGAGEQWVSLDKFSQEAAEIAREYGLKIQQVDNNKSRGRGEKLSAALPIGDNAEKSKERFKAHFVGYAEQNGDLIGATPGLRFANIPEDSRAIMGITKPGLEFAKIWNPLLDGGVSSDSSLTEEEADFYINHVRNELTEEFEAMQYAAKAISRGDNRPDSLSALIASLNEEWSDAQASTVRSGLVSRMSELDLVSRERIGQRGIEYKLSNKGRDSMEVEQ